VDWIRNIAYHLPGGSSRLTGGSAGVLFYNNTILTETSAGSSANVHWRNNLMLGENSNPAILSVNTTTAYSSSDYNGFRLNPGAPFSFKWNAGQFPTLAAYVTGTNQDRHSLELDYDVFVNVTKLDAKDLKTVQRLYKAEDFDFQLRPGSAAVDHGVVLPNVTDGFTGKAPDLGALEIGRPLPHYGPR
jgi:hypothetical protein